MYCWCGCGILLLVDFPCADYSVVISGSQINNCNLGSTHKLCKGPYKKKIFQEGWVAGRDKGHPEMRCDNLR